MQAETIAGLPVLSGLRADQLDRLLPLLQPVRFAAGDTMFLAGDPARLLYLVRSGEVRLRYHPHDGGCLDVATIGPGGALGWSAVLKHAQYTSSAICQTEVEALAIDADDLHRVMASDAALGDRLLENMIQVAANRQDGLGQEVIRLLRSDDRDRRDKRQSIADWEQS